MQSRLFTIIIALASISGTFYLVEKMVNSRAAFFSSALMSFSTVHVVIGRNIQTDMSAYLMIVLISLFYLQYSGEKNHLKWVFLLVGVGFYFKQTVAFLFPIIVICELKKNNVKTIIKSLYPGIFIPIIYVISSLTYTDNLYIKTLLHHIGGITSRSSTNLLIIIYELFWGISPLHVIAGLEVQRGRAGTATAFVKPSPLCPVT